MPLERRLHHPALHPSAAAVDQPDFAQAGGVRLADIFIDHRRNVAGMERVEVERIFDGDVVRMMRAVRHGRHTVAARSPAFFSYDAVTTVLIPPRTEKSPTTVMRLGLQAWTSSSRMRFVTAS